MLYNDYHFLTITVVLETPDAIIISLFPREKFFSLFELTTCAVRLC